MLICSATKIPTDRISTPRPNAKRRKETDLFGAADSNSVPSATCINFLCEMFRVILFNLSSPVRGSTQTSDSSNTQASSPPPPIIPKFSNQVLAQRGTIPFFRISRCVETRPVSGETVREMTSHERTWDA